MVAAPPSDPAPTAISTKLAAQQTPSFSPSSATKAATMGKPIMTYAERARRSMAPSPATPAANNYTPTSLNPHQPSSSSTTTTELNGNGSGGKINGLSAGTASSNGGGIDNGSSFVSVGNGSSQPTRNQSFKNNNNNNNNIPNRQGQGSGSVIGGSGSTTTATGGGWGEERNNKITSSKRSSRGGKNAEKTNNVTDWGSQGQNGFVVEAGSSGGVGLGNDSSHPSRSTSFPDHSSSLPSTSLPTGDTAIASSESTSKLKSERPPIGWDSSPNDNGNHDNPTTSIPSNDSNGWGISGDGDNSAAPTNENFFDSSSSSGVRRDPNPPPPKVNVWQLRRQQRMKDLEGRNPQQQQQQRQKNSQQAHQTQPQAQKQRIQKEREERERKEKGQEALTTTTAAAEKKERTLREKEEKDREKREIEMEGPREKESVLQDQDDGLASQAHKPTNQAETTPKTAPPPSSVVPTTSNAIKVTSGLTKTNAPTSFAAAAAPGSVWGQRPLTVATAGGIQNQRPVAPISGPLPSSVQSISAGHDNNKTKTSIQAEDQLVFGSLPVPASSQPARNQDSSTLPVPSTTTTDSSNASSEIRGLSPSPSQSSPNTSLPQSQFSTLPGSLATTPATSTHDNSKSSRSESQSTSGGSRRGHDNQGANGEKISSKISVPSKAGTIVTSSAGPGESLKLQFGDEESWPSVATGVEKTKMKEGEPHKSKDSSGRESPIEPRKDNKPKWQRIEADITFNQPLPTRRGRNKITSGDDESRKERGSGNDNIKAKEKKDNSSKKSPVVARHNLEAIPDEKAAPTTEPSAATGKDVSPIEDVSPKEEDEVTPVGADAPQPPEHQTQNQPQAPNASRQHRIAESLGPSNARGPYSQHRSTVSAGGPRPRNNLSNYGGFPTRSEIHEFLTSRGHTHSTSSPQKLDVSRIEDMIRKPSISHIESESNARNGNEVSSSTNGFQDSEKRESTYQRPRSMSTDFDHSSWGNGYGYGRRGRGTYSGRRGRGRGGPYRHGPSHSIHRSSISANYQTSPPGSEAVYPAYPTYYPMHAYPPPPPPPVPVSPTSPSAGANPLSPQQPPQQLASPPAPYPAPFPGYPGDPAGYYAWPYPPPFGVAPAQPVYGYPQGFYPPPPQQQPVSQPASVPPVHPQYMQPIHPITAFSYESDPVKYYVLGQAEFYFSVDNLCKDMFLRSQMDSRGWVDIAIVASFNRMKTLTTDINIVKETMELSSYLEVRGFKVRKLGDWYHWILPSAKPASPEMSQVPSETDAAHPRASGDNGADQRATENATVSGEEFANGNLLHEEEGRSSSEEDGNASLLTQAGTVTTTATSPSRGSTLDELMDVPGGKHGEGVSGGRTISIGFDGPRPRRSSVRAN